MNWAYAWHDTPACFSAPRFRIERKFVFYLSPSASCDIHIFFKLFANLESYYVPNAFLARVGMALCMLL